MHPLGDPSAAKRSEAVLSKCFGTVRKKQENQKDSGGGQRTTIEKFKGNCMEIERGRNRNRQAKVKL